MKRAEFALIFVAIIGLLSSCKPSDEHSLDKLYPIPKYPANPQLLDLDDNLKIQSTVLQPYVDEFNSYVSSYGTPILNKGIYYTFQDLSSLPGRILGKCSAYKNDNIILIDPTFWAGASDWDRRSVLFHELGHCVLGRGHRTLFFQGSGLYYDGGYKPSWPSANHYLADGFTINPNYRVDWPLSLMHRSIVREARFRVEATYYLTELFTEDGAEFVDNSFDDAYLHDECNGTLDLHGNIIFN